MNVSTFEEFNDCKEPLDHDGTEHLAENGFLIMKTLDRTNTVVEKIRMIQRSWSWCISGFCCLELLSANTAGPNIQDYVWLENFIWKTLNLFHTFCTRGHIRAIFYTIQARSWIWEEMLIIILHSIYIFILHASLTLVICA
jgi:hypothetical protein